MPTPEIFQSDPDSWEKIKDGIVAMEEEAFGEHGFTAEQLKEDFLNKNNFIIILKSDTDEVIGFTYARTPKDAEPIFADVDDETACMWDTIIKKEYRGQHLLGSMMALLEEELKKAGYKYMERSALLANNYAENIQKFYQGRIIQSKPQDSKWGPQIFFRIKL